MRQSAAAERDGGQRPCPAGVRSARQTAAAMNGAANARFARYPAAEVHREQAREQARRAPRPLERHAALAGHGARRADEHRRMPAPIAVPNAASNPAVTAATGMRVAPAKTAKSAGLPGRSPTSESPCDAPTLVHHRYTGMSGPTPKRNP